MRKGIARKCLCIALASAMVMGEAGTALAAADKTEVADSGSVVVEETVEDTEAESEEAVSEIITEDTNDIMDEVSDGESEESTDEVSTEEEASVTETSTEEPLVDESVLPASEETVEEDETAEIADGEDTEEAYAPTVDSGYVYSSGSYGIYMYASGYGAKADIYINNILYDTVYSSDPDSYYASWSYSNTYNGVFGVKYTVKVVAYDKNGNKTSREIGGVTTDSSKFNDYTSASVDTGISATGYKYPSGITVTADLDRYTSGPFTYEVYRATKANGSYSKVHTGTGSYGYNISYTDTNVNPGATYYYKIKLLSGTDNYVKTARVLSTSKVIKASISKPTASVSLYSYSVSDGKAGISVNISSDYANIYDIYRSTRKKGGYKKIKTVYQSCYTDNSAKKGKTYYYKVIPKYYNSKTGKTITGVTSDPQGVKYIMNSAYSPVLTQNATTSMKVEWYKSSEAGVSYEVWYKRTDISGDAYRKAASTKSDMYTLKGLASDGSYSVKIRTVKKAGSVVKYEESGSSERTMGYTDYVYDVGSSKLSSALSKDKKTLAIYYRLSWYRDWGASGYIISAYNNYKGKIEKIKTIKSGKTTSYKFRNTATKSKGIKYGTVYITPYKGKAKGSDSSIWGTTSLPDVKKVKTTRKSGSSVKITWTSVPGASSYIVYRSTALGTSQRLIETKNTYYEDKNITPNMGYTYSVYAITEFAGVDASYPSVGSIYTHKLGTPAIKKISNSASRSAVITWNKITNARNYIIYRSTSKNGTYKRVGATGKTTKYTDKKLAKGKTYYYKVVAKTVNDGGQAVQSAASKVKGVKISR